RRGPHDRRERRPSRTAGQGLGVAAPRATVAAPAVPAPSARARQVVVDYLTLTKPKVQSLLLLTTVASMEIAGSPALWPVVATCIGGYLSAGGAGAVNHWFDRDIDAQMKRTANRPIPSGRVAPAAALWFGIALAVLSFVWLTAAVNLLAATLALGGFLGYVFV